MITISYFGWEPVTFPETAEITDGENLKAFVVRLLTEQNADNIENFMFEHLVCKNGQRMEDDTTISDGDKISIYPPAVMG